MAPEDTAIHGHQGVRDLIRGQEGLFNEINVEYSDLDPEPALRAAGPPE
jgi:hypothetical protein